MDNTDLLEKVVNYIEVNEQTRNLLLEVLSSVKTTTNNVCISEEDKIKAAYALNMCTVSVSQIIDYSDLNILEQEYEAILNNLNLVQIPKDEALLHILRQLLDTITYFRIETNEKELIEKEYQQKMKNAIWSAVPNFGMIVAGGNPITMAISLASQVGIGYMNYRRNKAEYGIEKERSEWELQKTAIEQFNGLRRELFDTAWRLADSYEFPDGYRLTERQITHYNKILMDQDKIRKYERLEMIKEDFEAYPPFWYFIGNAANYIAGSNDISEETRKHYRKKALEYFDKFEKLDKFNILRQDQLVASCALEHIDLLLFSKNPDMVKIEKLLHDAVVNSKNSNDILELCALTYLKIGNQNEAAKILRSLVNEDYNKIINAQILSSIYVCKKNHIEYELLATRVESEYLYPMPKEGETINNLERKFGENQRCVLKEKYRLVLKDYLNKYAIKWNQITSIFDMQKQYPDDFFLETKKAMEERIRQAKKIYSNNNKKIYYQQRMVENDYELNILEILNKMIINLFEAKSFSDYALQQKVEESIRNKLIENKDNINRIQDAIQGEKFNVKDYTFSQEKIKLKNIVGDAFKQVYEYAIRETENANINDISNLEGDLREFCRSNRLDFPEILINYDAKKGEMFNKKRVLFDPQLFGSQAVLAKRNADFMDEMALFMKDKMKDVQILNELTDVYFRRTAEFNGYFYDIAFEQYANIKSHAIMVLKDKSKRKFDLIFTTDGIVSVIRDKVKNLTPYDEIKLKGDSILLYRNEIILTREYKTISFDVNILYDLICQIRTKFIGNLEDKTDYISGVVNPQILNQWFKERKDAMEDDVTRMYIIPKEDIIKHMGYHFEDELDEEKNLIQCYYETKTGNILGIRIVQFDNINSNFQAVLLQHNGILKMGK